MSKTRTLRPSVRARRRAEVLAAAACALAVAWLACAPRRAPLAAAPAGPNGTDEGGGPRALVVPVAGSRRATKEFAPTVKTPVEEPDQDALALVHGRMFGGRLPVSGRELELTPLAATAGSRSGGAWDLTDDDGGYEVRLAPGRYGVRVDGAPIAGAVLEVAAGALEQRSDLAVPRAPAGD